MDATDKDIVLLMIAAVFAALAVIYRILGRISIASLGRINVKKKYRFQQVVGEGPGAKLSPIIIAETNRFRDVERIRNTPTIIPPGMTVAIIFESEVQNAA